MKYGIYADYKDGRANGYYVSGVDVIKNASSKECIEHLAAKLNLQWHHMKYQVRELPNEEVKN